MNIEIANRLYEYRKKNGLSQEELAEKIGVSRQAVSKWERAESSPDTDNLILLSKLYGVSLDTLLYTDEIIETEEQKKNCDKSDDSCNNEPEKQNGWQKFPYPILVTILYLLLGFIGGFWHPGWILFLSIPVYYAIVNGFSKNKA